MSIGMLLLGAVLGTLAMTTLMSASQWLGFSRMSIPFMLGAMATDHRDRAMPIGFAIHVVNGLLFSFLYYAIFAALGPSYWLGLIVGAAHYLVVGLVILPILPGVHPRMASERHGPTPTKQLEPPGFLGLNYGTRTPLVGLLAHLIYGFTLGYFCEM